MQLPKLDRIVDTFVLIKSLKPDEYISQLRTDLIPVIRSLEQKGSIIWYGFLIHDQSQLGGRVPATDKNLYLHIRLCPNDDIDLAEFKKNLPAHFQKPEVIPVSKIAGVDPSILKGQDWAYGWKIHGEMSEWVLRFIDAHEDQSTPHANQIVQFLHFATNPLLLGGQSLLFPNGFLNF